ncbi:MAG: Immunoglobulin protein, partial [Verrucomicrobiaceae bacterium]|nr:Immunoglobulin protein [Verrucomicrobiaceae bacterium]
VSTAGSAFDTRLAVYTGTAINELSEVASNDEASDVLYTSFTSFSAEAGTTYFIVIDGFNFHDSDGDYNEYGAYVLKVTKLAAGAPSLPDEQAAPAWLPITETSSTGPVTAALRFQYPASVPGTQASWTVCNAARQPLFGLHLATGTGALTVSSLSAQTFTTGQTLVPNEKYKLELVMDARLKTWGALLNGEWIAQDQRLPTGTPVAGVQVQWTGSPVADTGVTVEEFQVTAE